MDGGGSREALLGQTSAGAELSGGVGKAESKRVHGGSLPLVLHLDYERICCRHICNSRAGPHGPDHPTNPFQGAHVIVPFHSSLSVSASTSAATLIGLEMASLGVRTALLDLDLLGGQATSLLGRRHGELVSGPAFVDVLLGRVPLPAAVHATPIANLFAMAPGSVRETGHFREGSSGRRMAEVHLYEQMEELSANFDVTLVALPDRLSSESLYVLTRASGFVAVIDPTRAGLRAHQLYVDNGDDVSLMNLGNLLAVLPFGRDIDRDLVDAFSAQYGAALLPLIRAEGFHEVAVFAGVPLRMVEPGSQSAGSVEHSTRVLLDRIAHRTGRSLIVGKRAPWDDELPAEEELSRMRLAFYSYVCEELKRMGQAVRELRA